MKKNIMISIAGVLCIATLTACASSNTDGRKIVNKDNKQITVLGKKEPVVNKEIALDKMTSLKDIRAVDWIDENTLLVMKENEEYPKIQLDSRQAYPKNLYEYDVNTQKLKLIAGSKTDMGYPVLSPDKKYIFYKQGVESNLTGFIVNRITGQRVQVTHTDSISPTEGKWIDNHTVIFSEFPQGGIYTADTDGNVKPIENEPKEMISNTAKLRDKVFYTTMYGKLYVQNINGTDRKLIKENVVWLIPSSNAENLAIVKRTEKTKMQLVVTDLDGNEKETLAEGVQIFGTNWSPDQSKIAYSVATDTTGKAGLFVSDIKSGKTIQLTVDIDLVADEVRWSPSGKKIVATNITLQNNEPQFITYILQLK